MPSVYIVHLQDTEKREKEHRRLYAIASRPGTCGPGFAEFVPAWRMSPLGRGDSSVVASAAVIELVSRDFAPFRGLVNLLEVLKYG